jgi:hypothetical protein
MNEALNAACAEKRTYMDVELLVAGNLVRTPQTRDLGQLLGIYALQGMVNIESKYLCITVKNAV